MSSPGKSRNGAIYIMLSSEKGRFRPLLARCPVPRGPFDPLKSWWFRAACHNEDPQRSNGRNQAEGVGVPASETWPVFDSRAAGFFGETRFFRSLGAAARLAGARRALRLRAGFFAVLTSPRVFLTFWTLGREIFNALAICDPVFPAFTNLPTFARIASVILARLRVLGTIDFLGRPTLPLPPAALMAATNALRESKP